MSFTDTEDPRELLRQALRKSSEHLLKSDGPSTERSLSSASLSDIILNLLTRCQAVDEIGIYIRLLLRFGVTLERTIPISQLDDHLAFALTHDFLSPDQFVALAGIRLRLLTQLSKHKIAQALLNKSRKVAEGRPELMTELFIREGVLLVASGVYAARERAYHQALLLAQAHDDKVRICITYNNLGNRAYALDQYNEALTYFQNALEIAQQLPDPIHRARAAGGMAMTLDELRRYEEAEYYGHFAKEAAEQSGDLFSLLNIELNLSYHAGLQDNFAEAIASASRALGLARQLGDWNREAFALHNLGQACLGIRNYEAACAHLLQALERRLLLRNRLLIQTTLEVLGQLTQALEADVAFDSALRPTLLHRCFEAMEAAQGVPPLELD